MKQILLFILIFASMTFAVGQRKVTPVEQKKGAITTLQGKAEAKKLLDKKVSPSMLFSDSVITDSIINPVDTTKHKVKMKYPLMKGLTIGVNLWDPIMRAFGQKYGLIDFSAELNMHNRFFPTVEVGFGTADSKPEDMNFRYKSPLSVFGKIGASYNFLYNKDEDYQFLAGFRLGYSLFKYDITEINVKSDYWKQDEALEILDQKSNATWLEIVLGLKIRLVKNVSMGWLFRYRNLFHVKENKNSSPWYIPGYGHRNRSINGSFSVYYTLPLNKAKKCQPVESLDVLPEKQAPTDSTTVNVQPMPIEQ